jgi:hypothetical protein
VATGALVTGLALFLALTWLALAVRGFGAAWIGASSGKKVPQPTCNFSVGMQQTGTSRRS